MSLATIAALFAISWVFVGPWADVPIIDDWVYAWSVEHLLHARQLKILDISAIYPIAQIVWGALFASLGGFSFGVLRLSTVVLAFIGCAAVYLTLRELECRPTTSLIGACALAVHPVYFALSFSFMTEVPFVALSTAALYCYVRAIRRRATRWLWAGSTIGAAAFLIRPFAIAIPTAVLASLVWREDRHIVIRRAAPLLASVAVMAVLQLTLPQLLGPLVMATIRGSWIQSWLMVPLPKYVQWNVEVAIVATFPVAPLLLAQLVHWRRVAAIAMTAMVLGIVFGTVLGELPMPLPDWQTWSLQDIAARAMVSGTPALSRWSVQATPFVQVAGLLALAALGFAIVSGSSSHNPRRDRAELTLTALGATHLVMINVLWLYNDRYYIVIAPILVIIAARSLDLDNRAKWVAVSGLAAWMVIALTGTRDMLAFSDACAIATRQLEASGIAPVDIDAGYPLNGWRLFAHPEHLPADADRWHDVPFVTSERSTRYVIASTPRPGAEVLRVIPLERVTWQTTRTIYVMRRW